LSKGFYREKHLASSVQHKSVLPFLGNLRKGGADGPEESWGGLTFRLEGIEVRQASAGASMPSQDFILVNNSDLITRSLNGCLRPEPGELPDS